LLAALAIPKLAALAILELTGPELTALELTKPLQVTNCHLTLPTTSPESFSLIGTIPTGYMPSWDTEFGPEHGVAVALWVFILGNIIFSITTKFQLNWTKTHGGVAHQVH
jgi:hypothetical protein